MTTPSPPFVKSVFHPTDFSEASRVAFAHALVIALLRQTRLAILHADDDSSDWTRYPGVRETLEQWGLLAPGSPRSAVFDEFAVRVTKIASKGNPSSATLEYIQDEQPDLVVLGTQGRSGLASWLRPSKAQQIVRRSRSMTLFVPAEGRPFVDPATGQIRLRRILLPVDQKPDADEALVRATRLATILGDSEVEIELLHVGEGSLPSVAKPEGEQWHFRETVLPGPVVETILSRAQEADLIVMATDGRDGVLDVFRGSFTERVVPEAPCPVLAVPAY